MACCDRPQVGPFTPPGCLAPRGAQRSSGSPSSLRAPTHADDREGADQPAVEDGRSTLGAAVCGAVMSPFPSSTDKACPRGRQATPGRRGGWSMTRLWSCQVERGESRLEIVDPGGQCRLHVKVRLSAAPGALAYLTAAAGVPRYRRLPPLDCSHRCGWGVQESDAARVPPTSSRKGLHARRAGARPRRSGWLCRGLVLSVAPIDIGAAGIC